MITLADPAKAPAEIERLTKLNEDAVKRIAELRAQHANEWAVINAKRGIHMREATIAELKAL